MLRLLSLELRQLARQRIVWLCVLLSVVLCALAFVNGRDLLTQQIEGRAVSAAEDAETEKRVLEQLDAGMEPADAVFLPFRVQLPIVAPMPPLIDFSAGRSAFDNYSTVASLRARADTLFKRTRLENPEALARGSLDLGFVVVVVAPLLLIALGYGVFAADRDSGTARLILAQGGSPLRAIAARSLPRFGLVLLPVMITAALLLSTGPVMPGRPEAAGWWILTAIVLLVFWWSIILFVNSFKLGAETAALSLVGIWAFFTLVLPPLIAAAAQIGYPPPSRFEQIAVSRATEVSSTTAYENDHPDLVSDDFEGRLASVRKSVSIGRTVEAAVMPISRRFEEQLVRQQDVVRTLAWLSPPLVAGDALGAVAGTDTASSAAFRSETIAYLAAAKAVLTEPIDRGTVLTRADYDRIPRFDWERRPYRPFAALAGLLLLTAVLTAIAVRRLASPDLN